MPLATGVDMLTNLIKAFSGESIDLNIKESKAAPYNFSIIKITKSLKNYQSQFIKHNLL